MVLVRKATSIEPRDMVGNWLYGVAYRTALEARKLAARRRNHEKKKHAMPHSESNPDLWSEMRPVLDCELSKLPDKYRVVLIACDLEDKTRSEVAGMLGVPEGTVASRLARARAMLAKRLERHRVIVSPLMLANLLADKAAHVALPEALVASVSQSTFAPDGASRAGVLADAVLKGMWWSKLKIAGAALCLAAIFGFSIASVFPAAQAEHAIPAQKSCEKPRWICDCIVREFDAETGEILAETITGENADRKKISLKLDPNAKIIVGGLKVKLKELHVGMVVNFRVCQDMVYVVSASHALDGVIQVIEKDKVTIQPDKLGSLAQTITIDPEAHVAIAGKATKVADVKAGMSVTAQIVAADEPRVVSLISPARKP
jgi:RNA polymerase sigma factor (sigma-70 family)